MESIVVAISPFLINGVVAFFKWFAGSNTLSTVGKRGVLAAVAIIGSIAYSQLMGEPINLDSISSLMNVVLDAFVAFLLAHGSYTLFWKK